MSHFQTFNLIELKLSIANGKSYSLATFGPKKRQWLSDTLFLLQCDKSIIVFQDDIISNQQSDKSILLKSTQGIFLEK